MKDFIAKIFLPVLFVLAAFSASAAEKVVFEVHTPLIVATGEPFRVEFSLNASPDGDSFKAPSFDGFDILAGPAESSGFSVQSINGSMTRSVSYTITYVLLPQAAGNTSIGPAEVMVDGALYRTKVQAIEVVEEKSETHAGQQSGGEQEGARSIEESAQNQIAKDDILLRTTVSRTSVFKGEPLLATIKLYMRANIVGDRDWKLPSFNGFWAQDLNTDDAAPQRETYNGKVYDTHVIKAYLLYPQQAGTLTIDSAESTIIAQVVVQNNRNSNPFFGGGHDFVNIARKIQSPRVNITVKELPAGAPAGFNGAVGNFKMDAALPPQSLAANSAATYTVKISGTGNLTFVQAPKLTLPGSFEQYNVKTTESINTSASGISGYRQFEYPFIARAEGTYDIAPVEFSYFDPARMQYFTLRSQPMEISISPDGKGGGDTYVVQGRGMSREEVKLIGQDIRFIKLGSPHLRPSRTPFLFSGIYWYSLLGILIFFAAVYFIMRKQIRESQNVALLRGKRANKIAIQRFRAAKRYMEQQDKHAFYEEMLRALWGYMSDKFNIPVANLTKENVREELLKRGIPADVAQRATAIITKCDEAQYSPAASSQMGEIYSEGVNIISRIEAMIKR